MAVVDIYGIQEALATILREDSTLSEAKVVVEQVPQFDDKPLILITATRWEVPEGQSASAGTRLRMEIFITVLIRTHSFNNVADAINKRDDLLGKVQLVLMSNRDIGDNVSFARFEGGRIPSGPVAESGFASEGEIIFVATASAIVT